MSIMLEAPMIGDDRLVMDNLPRHAIDQSPWDGFSREPVVSFSIAHTQDAILLKYFVSEPVVRVTCYAPNDPVYTDSCVEFFVSFNDGATYYNLEFNAVGTCLMAYGATRKNRESMSPEVIGSINYEAGLRAAAGGGVVWTLFVRVPLSVFVHESVSALSGVQARANFYKCGDELPAPHYLAWNHIDAPAPNFHLPEFFGRVRFL